MKKTHLSTFTRNAKELGLQIHTYCDGGNFSRILQIKNPKTDVFWMLAPKDTGFYPQTTQWFTTLCNSKILSEQVLRKLGYHTIRSLFLTEPHISNTSLAQKIAQIKTFPVVIKPEHGNKGRGIRFATNKREVLHRSKTLLQAGNNVLLQPMVQGTEYRILVINQRVYVAHSKDFPSIIGTGKHTIEQLLATTSFATDQEFINAYLKSKRLTRDQILPIGDKVPVHMTRKGAATYYNLLDDNIPPHIQRWGRTLAKKLNTAVVGIDVFIPPDPKDIESATIIEINASPGFMYVATKYRDKKIVDKICRDLLIRYFKL